VSVFSDGSRRFAQGFLPFALRANLRLSNFAHGKIVDHVAGAPK